MDRSSWQPALAEAGDFDSAVIWQQKAIQLYKRERSNDTSNSRVDGTKWLETVLEALKNHKAYREEPADIDFRMMVAMRQPTLPRVVNSLRRDSDL